MFRTAVAILTAIIVSCGLITTSSATTMSPSWPQFRYDAAHDGFNSGERIIGVGNASKLHPLWHWGGSGTYSDPVVANGSVFITSRSNGHCTALTALNATSGHPLWHKTVTAFQCVDPAISNSTIFLVTRNPWNLYALNTSTGKQAWSKTLPSSRFMAPTV
ncbi:MAG TPA: PQQ-binding-like beta-propeller repeat protein, partial [Chloroflexota bacterium]|nr:PQQ-binding-like beta-propeller repeat protein [Chloroflexota bacterium]